MSTESGTGEKQATAEGKKGPPIKVLGIVAGLMLAEAGAVYMFVGMTGSGTKSASAEIKGAEEGHAQQLVEIELIDDKFQNMQTGRTWMWDTQIVLKVKQRNEAFVQDELGKRAAEIREGVAQVMRRAQHGHLREPELTTLNRQLAAYLDKVFGPDAEGNSRVERVLIPKCRGFQIEQ
jgi:flagellar basal body-associated protein FliL